MRVVLSVGLILLAVACAHAQEVVSDRQPDIVVIMADDMGFSDLGCYGGEIETPNLDALADNGVRFTQFYNTSRCCPSRASLLTGLWPHQAEMGWMTAADGRRPGYRNQLSDTTITLPEALKTAGYATYMTGKWHLTHTKSLKAGPNGSWPTQRGFDHYYGTLEGAKDYFQPKWLTEGVTPIKDIPTGYFYTRAVSQHAADYIRGQDPAQPLFLYVAFYAPHFPLHAPKETVAKYRGRYMAGWDELRQARFDRQKTLGVVPADAVMSSRDNGVPAWGSFSASQQDEHDERMAIYAAQVDELDQGVGRIVKALEDTGRFGRTLIIFLSDNGAITTTVNGKGKRGQLNRSGPYTSYGRGWANLSNTPYRKFKQFAHEGGVMTPLIVHWPDRIQKPGALRHDLGHIIDIMPTCLEAAGAAYPISHAGKSVQSPEGMSLLPAVAGEPGDPNRALFFEHEGRHGVRQGNWKLVRTSPRAEWELYDLAADRVEEKNLATREPHKLKHLRSLWDDWAERCHVTPLDTRDWGKRIKDAAK